VPKTRQSRRRITVPLVVVDALREHRAAQRAERLALGGEWGRDGWAAVGLVFTTVLGTPIDHANHRNHLHRVCRAAGLGAWSPHELRHSAASLMLAAGTDLKVVSETLGHSSIRITADVYGHLLDGATGTATAAVAALITGPPAAPSKAHRHRPRR
jgi:integrase